MKEESVSGFDPREFSAIMADAPAPGVQFPQPLINPPQVQQAPQAPNAPHVPEAPQVPQVPEAPQAVNPPAQAAGRVAPALQPVQVNAADA